MSFPFVPHTERGSVQVRGALPTPSAASDLDAIVQPDQLQIARAVLADVQHHDDATIIKAAKTLAHRSPDHCDQTRATELLKVMI